MSPKVWNASNLIQAMQNNTACEHLISLGELLSKALFKPVYLIKMYFIICYLENNNIPKLGMSQIICLEGAEAVQ